MPYAIKGNSVYRKDTGKLVGKSKNPKEYLHTLQAVEHGFKPTHRTRASQLKKSTKGK